MVDLEGQDHGPSSSSVGDNDDDFIVYSKEGNNARWFKKEGDEVSAEDILCEVETDNATVAMECTEEVFLAKIIHGDGAKEIKVGEVPLSKIKGTGSRWNYCAKADNEDYLASSGKGVSAPPTSKPKDKATEARINYTDLPISQIRKDADKKGLSKIADEVKSFKQKAKENSLKPEDYEGGTFIVSNLGGTYGIKQFCAIINPAKSGILAVGSEGGAQVPVSDQYTFASYMSIHAKFVITA
ncbi:hypothetical protein Sjap_017964 [Stephania japonica]|uniref:Dihydrolipoamide acetyltransferase component of pyruvate dehydrogenase complex n=1 Tax=Stephania japonica TaxID=461633 RepID=A0AAP0I752_9MAGN